MKTKWTHRGSCYTEEVVTLTDISGNVVARTLDVILFSEPLELEQTNDGKEIYQRG